MDKIGSAAMKTKGDNITADIFDLEDLKQPIEPNDVLNLIALNRMKLILRKDSKDSDAINAAKLVMTYTKALGNNSNSNDTQTITVIHSPSIKRV